MHEELIRQKLLLVAIQDKRGNTALAENIISEI
jgi:hypothetical protein